MDTEIVEEVAKLNCRCAKLIGRVVATCVKTGDSFLIQLSFEDNDFAFNTDCYHILQVVRLLYDNPVTNAVMELCDE